MKYKILKSKLSIRETEILKLLVKGLSNPEIARALMISECTVKVHVSNILRKLSVKNRIEAVVFSVRNNLV